MTERLYYEQTSLREFDATVTGLREADSGLCMVSLDRSAFYPTSGGQPFDTGVLSDGKNEYPVTDVSTDPEGEVWHLVSAGLSVGDRVHGRIDWERRFDHMQQHGGEHMLAGAIWEKLGGLTIGLHLGKDMSTIDVTFPDGRVHVTADEIAMLEDTVNIRIQQNDPVRCWFPSEQELARLPLRKPPTVTEHIRIVAFGDYEMVACGGTHPSRTGEIGCIRILSVTPARGKARFAFVCGMRAVRLNRMTAAAVNETGTLLSVPQEGIPQAVVSLKEKIRELSEELKRFQTESLLQQLKAGTEILEDGIRLSTAWMEDGTSEALTAAVQKTVRNEKTIALAGMAGRIVFARSADLTPDMAKLIRETGKGGGRPEMATGAGNAECIGKAAEIIRRQHQ